jgi:hypothetical protein
VDQLVQRDQVWTTKRAVSLAVGLVLAAVLSAVLPSPARATAAVTVTVSAATPARGSVIAVVATGVEEGLVANLGACQLAVDQVEVSSCTQSDTSIRGSLQVPASLAPGTDHVVSVCVPFCGPELGGTVGSAKISIARPQVQFTPFPIERGQVERVWGSGFVAERACQILAPDAVVGQPTCAVSGTGEVTGLFVAPTTGDLLSLLVCQDHCKTTQVGGQGFRLVDAQPEITVLPRQARPGDSVQIHGVDFLPGGVEVLAWDTRTVVDDAPWGEFRLKLVLPPGVTAGRQRVRACSGTVCASQIILVLPPIRPTKTSGQSSPSATPSASQSHSTGRTPPAGTPSQATPSAAASSGGRWPAGPALLLAALLLTVMLAFPALALSRGYRGRKWMRRHVTTRMAAVAPLTADPEVPVGTSSLRVGIRPQADHGRQTLEGVSR